MSGIEWTDRSDWNPVRGCSRVSEGCRNCYAVRQASRFAGPGKPFENFAYRDDSGESEHFARWTGRVELVRSKLYEPLRWRKPARVFVNSMSDLFHEGLPDEAIDEVFAVMALAQRHTFQVLTKRPERMRSYAARVAASQPHDAINSAVFDAINATHGGFATWPLPNVWLGVSVEDQKTADERIPLLLQAPAAVRFVSYEPALGPVNFSGWLGPLSLVGGARGAFSIKRGIDWLIIGGESGPGARRCEVDWIRSAVRQAQVAGCQAFVKQLGAYAILDPRFDRRLPGWSRKLRDPKGGDPDEWPEDLRVREFPRERWDGQMKDSATKGIHVRDLRGLSLRLRSLLLREGIESVGQLALWPARSLLEIKGVGRRSVTMIQRELSRLDLAGRAHELGGIAPPRLCGRNGVHFSKLIVDTESTIHSDSRRIVIGCSCCGVLAVFEFERVPALTGRSDARPAS